MSRVGSDLPGLQNLIKRDPVVYHEEFIQQYEHFKTEYEIFKMNASEHSPSFVALVYFLGHISQCYPEEMKDYPTTLFSIMDELADVMDKETRFCIVKVLILLCRKKLIDLIPLLKSFFHFFRINDKKLRALLYSHIVTVISRSNRGKVNETLNRQLKSFMFDLLNSDSELIARKALDVMVELYRRQVWTDARSVNVISSACLSKHVRVSVGGIRFFLGIENRMDEDEAKSKEVEEDDIDRHAHSHKTRARKRDTEKQINEKRRKQRKANELAGEPRFPAIALVYDSQGFCEKLLNLLKKTKEQFSVRLLMIDIISRFIGYHKLCLFPFYSFIQSYLTAHQQQVTRILVFLVQGCHDYIPPEELTPLVRVIADNFVNDHSQPEVIALGLNTLSEIFLRIPLLYEMEEMEALIHDLVEYKVNKDKGVMIAGRNFMNNARRIYPLCLKKKDRGRDSDKTARPLAYGETNMKSMEGMEALGEAIEKGELQIDAEEDEMIWEEKTMRMNREGEEEEVEVKKWNPLIVSKELDAKVMGERRKKKEVVKEEEEEEEEEEEMMESEEEEMMESEEEMMMENEEEEMIESDDDDEMMMESEEEEEEEEEIKPVKPVKESIEQTPEERETIRQRRIALGMKAASSRLLTIKDYKVINKKKEEENGSDDDADVVHVANDMYHSNQVKPNDLLGVMKKKKDEIDERRRKAIEGRNPFQAKLKGGGTTNREKERKKQFVMVKQSLKVKQKLRQSIKEVQHSTKKRVKKLENMGKKANKRRRT